MIFETHAHYDDARFDPDRDNLLSSLPGRGIGRVINVAASIETAGKTLALAKSYEFIYAAIGVHPSETAELDEKSYQLLSEMAAEKKTVAIGEIGLDYHWDKEPEVQKRQRYWFMRQLKLAEERRLPVIIHSRDAALDTLSVLKEYSGNITGVIHCYSYSPELAEEFVRMGYYIGIGGVVTFKNAKKLKETVKRIPLERLLLETDCPYMAPEPHRGTRCDSSMIPLIVNQIAELKELPAEEITNVTWENAAKLFSLA